MVHSDSTFVVEVLIPASWIMQGCVLGVRWFGVGGLRHVQGGEFCAVREGLLTLLGCIFRLQCLATVDEVFATVRWVFGMSFGGVAFEFGWFYGILCFGDCGWWTLAVVWVGYSVLSFSAWKVCMTYRLLSFFYCRIEFRCLGSALIVVFDMDLVYVVLGGSMPLYAVWACAGWRQPITHYFRVHVVARVLCDFTAQVTVIREFLAIFVG
eukprot:gene2888-1870_t